MLEKNHWFPTLNIHAIKVHATRYPSQLDLSALSWLITPIDQSGARYQRPSNLQNIQHQYIFVYLCKYTFLEAQMELKRSQIYRRHDIRTQKSEEKKVLSEKKANQICLGKKRPSWLDREGVRGSDSIFTYLVRIKTLNRICWILWVVKLR